MVLRIRAGFFSDSIQLFLIAWSAQFWIRCFLCLKKEGVRVLCIETKQQSCGESFCQCSCARKPLLHHCEFCLLSSIAQQLPLRYLRNMFGDAIDSNGNYGNKKTMAPANAVVKPGVEQRFNAAVNVIRGLPKNGNYWYSTYSISAVQRLNGAVAPCRLCIRLAHA